MGPYLHSVGELSCEKGDFTVLKVTRKRYYILKVKMCTVSQSTPFAFLLVLKPEVLRLFLKVHG